MARPSLHARAVTLAARVPGPAGAALCWLHDRCALCAHVVVALLLGAVLAVASAFPVIPFLLGLWSLFRALKGKD